MLYVVIQWLSYNFVFVVFAKVSVDLHIRNESRSTLHDIRRILFCINCILLMFVLAAHPQVDMDVKCWPYC